MLSRRRNGSLSLVTKLRSTFTNRTPHANGTHTRRERKEEKPRRRVGGPAENRRERVNSATSPTSPPLCVFFLSRRLFPCTLSRCPRSLGKRKRDVKPEVTFKVCRFLSCLFGRSLFDGFVRLFSDGSWLSCLRGSVGRLRWLNAHVAPSRYRQCYSRQRSRCNIERLESYGTFASFLYLITIVI